MVRMCKLSAAALMVGTLAAAGCHKNSEPPGSPAPAGTNMPTTIPVPTGNQGPLPGPSTMAVPSANQTTVVLPAAAPPADKDLTHVLTKDQPYYLNEPGANPTPVGTLKEGSKVLVLIPGATYSQVITDRGVSAYTMTDGLKPLGK